MFYKTSDEYSGELPWLPSLVIARCYIVAYIFLYILTEWPLSFGNAEYFNIWRTRGEWAMKRSKESEPVLVFKL